MVKGKKMERMKGAGKRGGLEKRMEKEVGVS